MKRFSVDELRDVATELLRGFGASEEAGRRVATSLVDSELRGHASHGVIRLATTYEAMVETGAIVPEAEPTFERKSASIISVDGKRAFGQLTGRTAVEVGCAGAHETGVSVVGIRNGGHLGRIGEWAERAADDGLVFLAFVNSGGTMATVTAPGSADRLFATNPIAIGVPTFETLRFPIVLDMATSQVAHGKITKRSVDGKPLPSGWTITETGEPVEDAEAFEAGTGALLPLGGRTAGHKGFGLAVCAELFGGIIGGGNVYGQEEGKWVSNAGAFVFIDPLRFSTHAAIADVIASVHDHIKGATYPSAVETGVATDGDSALLPGEPEYRTLCRREAEGIPVSDRTAAALLDVGDSLGVDIALF